MTIPVWKKGLGLQKIDDVRICHDPRWTRKHLESLKVAYANAPYFADHLTFVEDLFSSRFEKLAPLNLETIRYLLNELQIRTEVVLLSELGIAARGELLPVEICRKAGGRRFLIQDSAGKYLNLDLFRNAGIQVERFKSPSPVYPQLWGDFIPDLSVFDLVFNCGPKARDILMTKKGG
ncbi:MAG: WbqC family protein [Syntrophobacteraceae bacterium]